MTKQFMPGRELCRLFFDDLVAPILARRFPDLKYGAGLFGWGSDVLGYDTFRSMDHDWGPRFQIFLAKSNDQLSESIKQALAEDLPPEFMGYRVDCTPANPEAEREHGHAPHVYDHTSHMVRVLTVQRFVFETLGIDFEKPIGDLDWLTFPEQRLLEITKGTIFCDAWGMLQSLQETFDYFPRDVWLYKIACQWEQIAQEEPFVGRCAETGDGVGMRLLVGRLVQAMMRLHFLFQRVYAPYSKWFGTAFEQLTDVANLKVYLLGMLQANDVKDIERYLTQAYAFLGERSNALNIIAPLDIHPREFFDRPYMVLDAGRFSDAYRKQIKDVALREGVGLFGAVDQFSNSTDMLAYPDVFRKAIAFYEGGSV